MRYIKLNSYQAGFNPNNNSLNPRRNKVGKLLSSFPGKFLIGLLILVAIIIVFIFSDSTTSFIFERTGLEKTRGRTNILILGTGGAGHAGGKLSDTIILASVDVTQKDVALVSLPRDLWIDNLNAKINTVYAIGEEKGKGLEFAKETIGEIVGAPIHYAVRVDFTGFARAIDLVGGIEVDVEQGFEDFRYPIAGRENDTCGLTIEEVEIDGVKRVEFLDATGAAVLSDDPFSCRYEYIQFKPGLQQMDGATALKFVRSRMGTNGAGSDFARSQRQKQVILAVGKKVFDLKNLFSPKKVAEIITTFDEHVDTDFTQKEFSQIPTILPQLDKFKFRSLPLTSESETGLLYNPPISEFNAWVLLPKNNDWQKLATTIKQFIYSPVNY